MMAHETHPEMVMRAVAPINQRLAPSAPETSLSRIEVYTKVDIGIFLQTLQGIRPAISPIGRKDPSK